ncbi:hypothetical protein SAMN06296386_109112 [Lachnospiraceae bacterium]|nr:hypothetical protein SAMN06296386_109112 [Lachnospiraceae bacterium]
MKWKNDRKDDSRALLEDELGAFEGRNPQKPLQHFVQLVRENSNELELCFRGNSESAPRISIYKNNHIIFSVLASGKLEISFNHARYYKDWEKAYYSLVNDYGFSEKKYDGNGNIDIGKITRSAVQKGPLSYEQISKIYKDILIPIFDSYFEASENGKAYDYYKGEYSERVNKNTEKIKQQALYSKLNTIEDGYFFYDLEFAQRHENIACLKEDKNNNKPDMWGLKFDKNGKPEKIVVAEVKCTKGAMNGTSGIVTHLEKMRYYDIFPERRKEACQIMNQYAMLGLRNLNSGNYFNYEDFKSLEPEILLIFTGEAAVLWKNDKQYENDRKKTHEIQPPKGIRASFFVVND